MTSRKAFPMLPTLARFDAQSPEHRLTTTHVRDPPSNPICHLATIASHYDSGAGDLFALGLEQILIKKLKSPNLRGKNWPWSEKHFKKKNILKKLYILS